MEKAESIGLILGFVLTIIILIVQYTIKSPIYQIFVIIGIILAIFIVLLFWIVSKKFKDISNFIDTQETLNKKNEEKFKIYERLANIEAKLNLLEK